MTTADRYVAIGLARARAPWFRAVARWANTGTLAMDFVKAISVDEVRARFDTGRAFSALLVDAGMPGVDRDLLASAHDRGCAVILVGEHAGRTSPPSGVAAVLAEDFDRATLTTVLRDHATAVGTADDIPGVDEHADPERLDLGRVVAVTGPGGTGTSTVAMAIAQGLAHDTVTDDEVVLADLALHADQAVLHDARDVIPGVLELVESHRGATLDPHQVRALTFEVVSRRYRLLLGLRRHRDWAGLRPRATVAALTGLRHAFPLVVADVDADLEGQGETGSTEIEDRNLLARTCLASADVVVVVGTSGVKGVHSLLRTTRDVLDHGADASRLVLVVNRSPRRGPARAETIRAVTDLLSAALPTSTTLSPVFVPDRHQVEDAIRDGMLLPAAVVDPVARAVRTRLDRLDGPSPSSGSAEPTPVAVGSLGVWSDDDEEEEPW